MGQPTFRQRRPGRQLNTTPTPEEVEQAKAAQPPKEATIEDGQHTHTGRVFVRRASYGQEAEHEERILVPLFTTAPARIGITASTTRNLGDYNSARVEVMIELPCYPEVSEMRRAVELASDMLDEIIPIEQAKAGFPQEQ